MNIFLIAAQTVDGFIARDASHLSTRWSSKKVAQWFNSRTKQAGVIVMGRKTFDTIGRGLPGRVTIVMTRTIKSFLNKIGIVEKNNPHGNPC